jgi:hypothetical protein
MSPFHCCVYNCCFTGSTVDYRDGFVGCIRALLLSGQLIDLRSYANRGLYGKKLNSVVIKTRQESVQYVFLCTP